jgi:prepilin-type N-terminal cleavage/methylation domain-containing protein
MNNRGYTLIESILVVGVVAIGLALAVPLYRGYLSDRALQNAAYLIQSDLRLGQQAAISRAGNGPRVEMCFAPTGYEVYAVDYTDVVNRTGAAVGVTLKSATAGKAWRAGIAITPDASAVDPCLADAALSGIVFSGAGVPISFDDASAKSIILALNGESRRVRITPTTGRACVDDPAAPRCP